MTALSETTAAVSQTGNGTLPAPPTPRVPPRELRQARFAQAFSSIVAVLMRDPNYRNLRIADLEHLVLPAVMSGQWRLAHAAPAPADKGGGASRQAAGTMVPVAAALWARVSSQVDDRLSRSQDKGLVLRSSEWASGSHLWLIAAAGDQRALPGFLKQLRETEFKDKLVKLRVRDAEGKPAVKLLDEVI